MVRELGIQVVVGSGQNPLSKSIARILATFEVIRTRNLGVREVLTAVGNRARARLAGKLISQKLLTPAKYLSPRISSHEIMVSVQHMIETVPYVNSHALQGKRVALVGPGFRGTDTATLSGYEVIARIGFSGWTSVANPEFSRCDLSFLAPWHAQKLLDYIDANDYDFGEVKFFLREDVGAELCSALAQRVNIERFSTFSCNRIFKGVTPNFGPQIVIWLLSQSPSNLHLSHIDLMTDPRRPHGYATNKRVVDFESVWQHEKATIQRSFAQFHNPYTHFSFFESLIGLPTVSYSPTLGLIIKHGIHSYSSRLSDLYFGKVTKE